MGSAEPLPDYFDVIVAGTGLQESIIAAACARLGFTVLHLDRNEYYGGPWSSFNLEGWEKWVKEQNQSKDGSSPESPASSRSIDESLQLNEGAWTVLAENAGNLFQNVSSTWMVPSAELEVTPTVESESECKLDNENLQESPVSESYEETIEPSVSADIGSVESNELEKERIENNEEFIANSEEDSNPDSSNSAEVQGVPEQNAPQMPKKWTKDAVETEWRRFSIDISPKILCGRGKMVQVLISSGVSRYAEFKSVDRILTWIDGKMKQVPCSRSDVFQTKDVTMIQKRRLMKFLTFCLNYETETDEYAEYEDRTFQEFLLSRDLSPELCHYVRCAIGMVSDSVSTKEGLKAVHKFLMSVGKFGNSPFLWTLYGSGELPQCFCRLCAVFGGVYCLRRSIDAWIINEENKIAAVVSEGQRINCGHVICDPTYVPKNLMEREEWNQSEETVHRAVVITSSSLAPDTKEHVSLLNLDTNEGLVRLLELPPGAMVCPKSLCLIHMTAITPSSESEPGFSSVLDEFFDKEDQPEILWKSFYRYEGGVSYRQFVVDQDKLKVSNIGVTAWPDSAYDYESAVSNAENVFRRFWPTEDFLPEIPQDDESAFPEASDAAVNGFVPPPEDEKVPVPTENTPDTAGTSNAVADSTVQSGFIYKSRGYSNKRALN